MDASPPADPPLSELQALVSRFRDERDWAQFHTLKDLAAAIAIEASELQQELLWVRPEDEAKRLEERRDAIANELADVLILSLSLADVTCIDPAAAILQKVQSNADRYPVDKSRGTSAKYSEPG
jgi:dCTP diphosphatase